MPKKAPGRSRKRSARRSGPGWPRGFISMLSPMRSLSRMQMVLVVGLVAVVGATAVYVTRAATATQSLFLDSDKPAEIATWDRQAAELGVRFTSKEDGTVTGVRFYKAKQNTGLHVGHLWDSQGKMLANATFSKESASGWQTVTFAKPVNVKAGVEYVASYHTDSGYYAMTTNYFDKAHTRGSLTAPANSRAKKNGVSRYGGSGFPSSGYQSSNYWVDVVFRPVVKTTPVPTPVPSDPRATPTPVATATPTAGANLSDPAKKEIAMKLVSSAENSSLDWKAQYGYIEDIKDGRGYTGGIIGFCSGCGDMAKVVAVYNGLKPGNVLSKYYNTLVSLGNAESASHSGLDPNFTKDWKTASTDPLFQQAQNSERDRVYFNPSVNQAVADGLHALGQFIYYDAMVMHGPGNDSVSFGGIRAAAMKKAKTPAQGGNETTYLNAFLDARKAAMLTEEAHSETSRVDTQQRSFLSAGNLNLNPPLSWKTYGDSYSIK